jgi:hypothetical protein
VRQGITILSCVSLTKVAATRCPSVPRHRFFDHAPAAAGHSSIVKLLMEHGANTNTESRRLGTAFHAVSSRGHWNIAGLLVVHGAKGHQQSDEGISRARTNGWAIIAFIPGAENKDSEFRQTTPLLQQDSAKMYLGAPGRMGLNYYLLRQLIRVCPVIALCHSMSHY